MKKLISIVGVGLLMMALLLNINKADRTNDVDLATLTSISTANAENASVPDPWVIRIPIQIGTKNCVCKKTSCIDANVISFRTFCGPGVGIDSYCSSIGDGSCA